MPKRRLMVTGGLQVLQGPRSFRLGKPVLLLASMLLAPVVGGGCLLFLPRA